MNLRAVYQKLIHKKNNCIRYNLNLKNSNLKILIEKLLCKFGYVKIWTIYSQYELLVKIHLVV